MAQTQTNSVKSLKADLDGFIAKWNLGATKVWTSAEWKARGEKYGDNSPFILTTEDALYDSLNGGCDGDLLNELRAIAKRHGRYIEQGYSWSLGFYKV